LQKIAYFATEAGIPTELTHVRGSYGPFSAELKPLLARLANNGLLREHRHGRMFLIQPGPTYDDAVKTFGDQLNSWKPMIDRVADLLLRVRTDQAEVAATALFAARQLSRSGIEAPTEMDILNSVKEWKQRRKPPLEDEEIAGAIRQLNMLRWFDARPSDDLPLPYDELAAV